MSTEDLFPASIDDQIGCVERELRYRRHVYARRVGAGKLSQKVADRELRLMTAVLGTLQQLKNSPPYRPSETVYRGELDDLAKPGRTTR